MYRVISLLLFLSCASAPAPAPAPTTQVPLTAAEKEAIDAVLADFIAGKSGGITVAVSRQGSEAYRSSRGDVDLDTTFQVGSVTKQFTAALIEKAVSEQRLRTGDLLAQYIPLYENTPITIGQLLAHTSGIQSYTALPAFRADPLKEWTHDEMIALLAPLSLEFAPGLGWNYSNSGYYLLGVILEDVYQRPYRDLLQDELFGPLELHNTEYCTADSTAPGYSGTAELASVPMTQPFSAGAICTTIDDLLRWSIALQTGDVTDTDFTTPTTLLDGKQTPYRDGIFIGRNHWRVTRGHGGNIPGYTARTAYYPELGIHIVVMTNQDGAPLHDVEASVVDIFDPQPAPSPPPPMAAAEAESLTGRYIMTGFPEITIVYDGELKADFGSADFPLIRYRDLDFLIPQIDLRIRFTDDRMEIEQSGILIPLFKEVDG